MIELVSTWEQNETSRATRVNGCPALNTKSTHDFMPSKNLPVGTRFGKLVILGEATPKTYPNGHTCSRSVCLCDCGKRKEILNISLKTGKTTSCGCYHSQVMRSRAKHGMNRSNKDRHPIYAAWNNMVRRCTVPTHPGFKYYGGRGITVCERWMRFENFLEDMRSQWTTGLTLERKDNGIGYFPGNCKWATRAEQMRNMRRNRMISFEGQTLCLSDWAAKLEIPVSTLSSRLHILGWSNERTLTTPWKPKCPRS